MEIVPLTEDAKTGAEALRDGVRVARLVGALGDAPSRGRHAWVGLADHSLDPAEQVELLADVYAVAGAAWVADDRLTHIVEVLAEGPLPQLFFSLGFGQEQVHAAAPARSDEPSTPVGAAIRQAGPLDLEVLLGLVGTIAAHQAGAPVWSGLPVPGREQLRADWAEFLAEDGVVVLVAELDGQAVGYAGLAPDRPGVAHLPVAATLPTARGRGIGVALAEHALHRAQLAGAETVELDWRSANLLASRFWPKRGFVPTHLRLRRDVRPNA